MHVCRYVIHCHSKTRTVAFKTHPKDLHPCPTAPGQSLGAKRQSPRLRSSARHQWQCCGPGTNHWKDANCTAKLGGLDLAPLVDQLKTSNCCHQPLPSSTLWWIQTSARTDF